MSDPLRPVARDSRHQKLHASFQQWRAGRRTKKINMKIKPQPKDARLISLAVPIYNGDTLKSPTALPSLGSILKGIALGSVGILALTVSKVSGDKNPCMAALKQATTGKQPASQKAPAEPKSSNPVKSITEGISASLKSLFDGKWKR